MFLHTWHPQPLIGAIGGLQLHWYGLMLALGALAGLLVFRFLARRQGLAEEHVFDLFFYLLIFGFIGGRLYHVSNEWTYYGRHPADIVKVWNGGLAIHGAIIAGLIVLFVYARRKRLSAWLLADLLAPALVIGQAIGRWGNYFNQELFGRPTGLPWSIPIDLVHRPVGYQTFAYFHPTFLYESLGNIIIFGLLLWWLVRRPRLSGSWWRAEGGVVMAYFILYSALRAGTEWLRIDRVPHLAGLRLPLLVSLILIAAAAAGWVFLVRRYRRIHAAGS